MISASRFPLTHLRADMLGGLTTAIVSLPLSLAFGIASGAGAEAGLYGAIFVGLFSVLFGSATRLVSEPTGPMTVFMAALIISLQAEYPEMGLAMAFSVVVVAGFFQILLGALKMGQFVTLMPYGVISGFMSGIGILLMIMQVPALLGHRMPAGGTLAILRNLPDLLQDIRGPEAAIAFGALLILWLYPSKWKTVCPPQLFVMVLAGAVSAFVFGDEALRRVGEIHFSMPELQIPVFQSDMVTRILLDGMVLALLGSIDALLTAMISDGLTREYHDSNRELIGQGIGNMISGLFGGLPGAGATLRTVLNIQVGSRTATSGLLRVAFLIVILLGAAPLLSPVPMAVLAAITFKIGWDILDWSFIKRVHHVSLSSTGMMYAVLLLTVFYDIVLAVGVGVFIANMLTIKRLSDLHSKNVGVISVPRNEHLLSPEEQAIMAATGNKILLFHMSGPMIFGVAKAISREHTAMDHTEILLLDLKEVPLLGVTVCLTIENMVADALEKNAKVFVIGAGGRTRERLEKFKFFERPGISEYPTRLEALKAAETMLKRETSG